MYAALAAESESGLAPALLDQDDVGRAHSLQKQFAGPPNFRDQRIRLYHKLVHILGRAKRGTNVAQENVVSGDRVRADRSLPWVLFSVDVLIEGKGVASVRCELESHVEFPRLLEGRSLGGVSVSPGQARRNRIRVTIALTARRTKDP